MVVLGISSSYGQASCGLMPKGLATPPLVPQVPSPRLLTVKNGMSTSVISRDC